MSMTGYVMFAIIKVQRSKICSNFSYFAELSVVALSDPDRIDRRIQRELQDDGRITNLKLAESVALSPTAVLRASSA